MFKFNFIADADDAKDKSPEKEIVSGKFYHLFCQIDGNYSTGDFQFFIQRI